MNLHIRLSEDARFRTAIDRLANINIDAIRAKQVAQLSQRAAGPPGGVGATPRDTGELRISAHADLSDFTFGYTKHYAPHVEYGHRTVNGGYVPGQYFLKANVETQAEIYIQDVKDAIEEAGK